MKSEARQDCLRKSSQTVTAACSQLWENVQASTSTTLGEDTYSSVDQQNGGMQQKHLKDEPKQDSLYSLADYCSSFFDNRKVVSSPDVLIPDTSVAIGVTNQAGQTCPPGVVLQDPANPDAVFNTEETVSADVHSGSSQGDATNQEDDMTSPFSWVRRVRVHPLHKKEYQCSHCGKCFSSLSAFKPHERIHTGEKPYECSQCGKSFNRQIALKLHERIHTGEKPYKCSECGKTFNRLNGLLQHRRVHTGEKPYHCAHCGKSFSNWSQANVHERIHTGEKPYHCSECGKSFAYKQNFELHQRTHTGHKPYYCSVCDKFFTQPGVFQVHQRTHTGETPYHCEECGKGFSHYGNYKRHQLIHTGQKPYHCSECGKGFTQLTGLQAHQRIHTQEKQCDQGQNT